MKERREGEREGGKEGSQERRRRERRRRVEKEKGDFDGWLNMRRNKGVMGSSNHADLHDCMILAFFQKKEKQKGEFIWGKMDMFS